MEEFLVFTLSFMLLVMLALPRVYAMPATTMMCLREVELT